MLCMRLLRERHPQSEKKQREGARSKRGRQSGMRGRAYWIIWKNVHGT